MDEICLLLLNIMFGSNITTDTIRENYDCKNISKILDIVSETTGILNIINNN